ncbi:uncharacterized protein LOC121874020 [Homarus americanus]|uniref:uncharacterized protein LOC121874020 n=1 Tax=Homarus americanus TaxID=6706 RepID=UPI001C46386B|nr:uncharacterized protein LOC121874020 [Homarus americanus]
MGYSPKKERKQGVLMALWTKVCRLINLAVACIMGFTALLQMERPDALIWVPLFLVPAFLTFIISVHLRSAEKVEVRAVTSVHIGCCLCYLVYLATSLLRALTFESINFSMVDPQAGRETGRITNFFSHHETWECIAVGMIVAWLKFLSITSKDHLRDSGAAKTEVSPIRMLWTICVVLIVPFCLLSFCYIDGLLPFISSAAKDAVHTAQDALQIIVNVNSQPNKLTGPA